jgi:hypothetical protein
MASFVGSKSRSLIVFFALLSVILFFFLFDVAFRELSFLKTHFWPFTEVMRRIRPEVTRKTEGSMSARASRQRLMNFQRSGGVLCLTPEAIPLPKCPNNSTRFSPRGP